MDKVVRETVDGDKEILENLLNRVINEFQEERISWVRFIGFFSKRGKLEGYIDLTISPSKKAMLGLELSTDE